ncbi:putative histidine kinase group protein [Parathielavia hyrcaniae]|uniref:Histidine kinase group protein n=1 Tax=Parathielavia hyrcaniae TaxID=113614 RepID=A0AAN6Q2D6_9PEZI|nr:putative histidine kinase group protein [Parathielavia hyrcaniae]
MQPTILETSIIDLLEADHRPTLIVARAPHPPTVVYTNPAFAAYPALVDLITNQRHDCAPLWKWITGPTTSSDAEALPNGRRTAPSSFSYSDIYWTKSVVHDQMVVVGANDQIPSPDPPRKVRLDAAADSQPSNASPPRRIVPAEPDPAPPVATDDGGPDAAELLRAKPTPAALPMSPRERPPSRAEAVQSLGGSVSDPGWILPDITPEQRPFLADINSVDWAATPLGPMGSWHRKLDETVNQILVDSRPIAIYWGPSYITIYNEAFSKLCGSKHPSMLGMPVQEAWAEAGQRLRDTMQGICPDQRSPVEDEWRFFVERDPETDGGSPWLEETYLKWSMVPIVENSQCLGFMHPVAETTSVRLWERRMAFLTELGEVLVTARDVNSYWERAIQKFAAVEPRYDIPLAILYKVENDPEATAADARDASNPAKICRLAGTLGVPEKHSIAPESVNLRTSDEKLTLASSFRQAIAAQHPTLLRTSDGTLPPLLLEGLQWRGFEGDTCRSAVICPIRPTKQEDVMGFLLLGINPRRPYDNDYRQFISLLSQKLSTSLASIVLLEEEARRGRNAAEQAKFDKAMLQEKLEVQTKEANESIQKFEAVAEFIPVGMCIMEVVDENEIQGNITYANDAWYKITGYPATAPISREGFFSRVKEEDRPVVIAGYDRLKTARNVEFEFRVQRHPNAAPTDLSASLTRTSPNFEKAGLDLASLEERKERHILAMARAECGPDGRVIRVLTCLTDVSAMRATAEEATRRAQQAENLKRMAEFATVGMYDMDLDGRLLGANKVFFEMCGLQDVDPLEVPIRPWELCVRKEDLPLLTEKLERMVLEDKVQNVEVRLNTTWTAEDGSGHMPRSVQATLMPVKDTEGVIRSFTGCISDVSRQSYQLAWEKERKEEALESKRQQENFIDMTSHEMRNPLSAIIHCADAITGTLSRVQELLKNGVYGSDSKDTAEPRPGGVPTASEEWLSETHELVESSIENAETIVTCAQHQKRIVDDILTMSKLDSSLLSITRITVNPIKMVREALKMFEVEARRVDINLSMVVDPGYYGLGIRYLDFDPSRLKQVLINLLTNALKFTKAGPTRNVTVTLRASLTQPTEATSKVQFIPRSQESLEEVYDQPVPLNMSHPVYLMFEVEDTGEGLTEDEKNSLFQRFVQASSRTHLTYGGSGLGLFISRRLTELQGGAIGVASTVGVGSTFAFYIEAYRPTEDALREAEAGEMAADPALSALRVSPGPSRRGSTKRAVSSGTLSSECTAVSSSSTTTTTTTTGGGGGASLCSPGLASSGAATAAPSASVTPSSEICVSPMGPPAPMPLPPPPITGVMVVEDNLINQQITRRGLINMGFTVDVANHGVECLDKLRRTDRYAAAPSPPPSGSGSAYFDASSSSSPPEVDPPPSLPPSSSPPRPSPPIPSSSSSSPPIPSPSPPSSQPHPPPKFPLSVILMDIEMPIQDGLTCTRNIRELERSGRIVGGRIPIIAVSANARLEQIVEAREAGCDDVLVKPYRMPELLERMKIVMARVAAAGVGVGVGVRS